MRTDARGRLAEYYTDDLAKRVVERFRPDFEAFGYATDPSVQGLHI
jgi:hypothetical protein